MQYGKVILGLGLLAGAAPATPQEPRAALKEGDVLIGIGAVEALDTLHLNDRKLWTTVVVSTFSNPDLDVVLLSGGFVTLREGMLLPSPKGAVLDELEYVQINNKGDLASTMRVRFPGTPSGRESVLWNTKVINFASEAYSSALVPSGSTLNGFDVIKINENNQLLVAGEVRSPGNPSIRDILFFYQLDAQGNLISRTELATRLSTLDAMGGQQLGTIPATGGSYAFNDDGEFLWNPTSTLLINAVMRNTDEVLAMDGEAAPIGFWETLNSAKVALNDKGDYAYTGTLAADADRNFLIVKNGQKFVQEGDILPDLSDQPIGGGSPAPIVLTNSGDVFWRTTAGGIDAFMRNTTPIVRLNQVIDGAAVIKLENDASSFAASKNGRFFVGNVDLAGIGDALVLVDFGLVLELPGCVGNPGALRQSGGAARVGQTLTLAMDNGHVLGALPKINFSSRQRIPGSECGIVGPRGESLISPAHRVGSILLAPWDGASPSEVSLAIPPDVALIDGVLFAQGNFRRPGSATDITLTNGLRIEIGAP
jgi:hypothetical protein